MDDPVAIEAARRHAAHVNHPTHRPLSVNYELIALRGEQAFADTFGLAIDLTARPGGDGGRDFELRLLYPPQRFIVDVKCAIRAFNLIVERGHVAPKTIYVLAQYNPRNDRAHLVGWQWGEILRQAPVKDFGYGISNHYIPANQLRNITELHMRRAL